jgi:hypothetical protein
MLSKAGKECRSETDHDMPLIALSLRDFGEVFILYLTRIERLITVHRPLNSPDSSSTCTK